MQWPITSWGEGVAIEPLADDSQLIEYAQTPAPKTAESVFQHAPIPTVEVSNTEVLGQGILDQLANQFSPDDSEPNSKEKTIRPGRSQTDIDSDRPAAFGPRDRTLLEGVAALLAPRALRQRQPPALVSCWSSGPSPRCSSRPPSPIAACAR